MRFSLFSSSSYVAAKGAQKLISLENELKSWRCFYNSECWKKKNKDGFLIFYPFYFHFIFLKSFLIRILCIHNNHLRFHLNYTISSLLNDFHINHPRSLESYVIFCILNSFFSFPSRFPSNRLDQLREKRVEIIFSQSIVGGACQTVNIGISFNMSVSSTRVCVIIKNYSFFYF